VLGWEAVLLPGAGDCWVVLAAVEAAAAAEGLAVALPQALRPMRAEAVRAAARRVLACLVFVALMEFVALMARLAFVAALAFSAFSAFGVRRFVMALELVCPGAGRVGGGRRPQRRRDGFP
jgi:hypothetical protein